MTLPSFRAGVTFFNDTLATSGTRSLSFATTGDMGVIAVANNAGLTGVSSPSGAWSLLCASSYGSVYAKILTSGDVAGSATLTFASSARWAGVAMSYQDCSSAEGLAGSTGTSTTTCACPAIGALWDESLHMLVGIVNAASAVTGSWSAPTGYTVRESASESVNKLLIAAADQGSTATGYGNLASAHTFTAPDAGNTCGLSVLLAGSPQHVSTTAALEVLVGADAVPARDGAANGAWPQLVYEVAFSTGPNSTAMPSWEEISPSAASLSVTRGRSYELAQSQPGSGSLGLRNTTGDFDPANTSGAYYPNVKPLRKIRCHALWNGTRYPVWAGNVYSWPLAWTSDILPQASCQLVDALGTLRAGLLPALPSAMAADGPLHLWPFTESLTAPASGETITWTFGDEGSSPQPLSVVYGAYTSETLTTGATLPPRSDGKLPADSSEGVHFSTPSGSNGAYKLAGTVTDGVSLFPKSGQIRTYEMFAVCNSTTAQPGYIALASVNDGTTSWLTIGLNPSSSTDAYLLVNLRDSAGGFWSIPSSVTVTPWTVGTGQHVALTIDATGGAPVVALYINGEIFYVGVATTALPTSDVTTVTVGGDSIGSGFGYYGDFAVNCFGMWGRVLGSAEVRAHWDGYVGFTGDTTGERATRLFTWGGWNGQLVVDSGNSTMQAATATGNLQSALQQVVDTEFGQLYADAAGAVVVADRTRLASTTATATFGDGSGEIPFLGDVLFTLDPQYTYDRVAIQRNKGVLAAARNATTTTDYYANTLGRVIYSDSDSDAVSQAAYLASEYAAPATRVSTVTVDVIAVCNADVENSTTLADTLLGLDIGDVVTVTRRGYPTTVTGDFRIQQIADQITSGGWKRAYQFSPVMTAPTW